MSRVTHIRRPSRRTVHLTQRDVLVLEVLAQRRAETLDDYLLHKVFTGASRKRALNRLGELVSAGFLARTSVVLVEGERERSLYSLTGRGRNAALRRSLLASEMGLKTRGQEVPLASLPHEYWTNRVRDWLGGHPLAPHEVLHAFTDLKVDHRPDLLYRARESDDAGRRLVWVEVDMGHYSARRIAEKLRAFRTGMSSGGGHGAEFLLFACPTVARREWLRTVISGVVRGRWEYVDAMTFADLRAGGRIGYTEMFEFPGEVPLQDLRPDPAVMLRDWV